MWRIDRWSRCSMCCISLSGLDGDGSGLSAIEQNGWAPYGRAASSGAGLARGSRTTDMYARGRTAVGRARGNLQPLLPPCSCVPTVAPPKGLCPNASSRSLASEPHRVALVAWPLAMNLQQACCSPRPWRPLSSRGPPASVAPADQRPSVASPIARPRRSVVIVPRADVGPAILGASQAAVGT